MDSTSEFFIYITDSASRYCNAMIMRRDEDGKFHPHISLGGCTAAEYREFSAQYGIKELSR